MKEIALHILDIAQNAVNAEATQISIRIWEDARSNATGFRVEDNGRGMNAKTLARLSDPFFTTGNKKTGLGIPLLRQHAEAAGGSLKVESEVQKGTTVTADFVMDHIDRQPMGDVVSTLIGLIRSYPDILWEFHYRVNEKEYCLRTQDVSRELEDIPLNHPRVIEFIRDMLRENIAALSTITKYK